MIIEQVTTNRKAESQEDNIAMEFVKQQVIKQVDTKFMAIKAIVYL